MIDLLLYGSVEEVEGSSQSAEVNFENLRLWAARRRDWRRFVLDSCSISVASPRRSRFFNSFSCLDMW